MRALSIKKELAKIATELKKYSKVMAIILFGSYAKGRPKPISDVDVAVIIKEPDKKIEAEVASLSSPLFDVVNFHRLPLYIQFEVLKSGRLLFVRDKKYLTKVRQSILHEYLEMSLSYARMARAVLA